MRARTDSVVDASLNAADARSSTLYYLVEGDHTEDACGAVKSEENAALPRTKCQFDAITNMSE